VHIDHPFAVLTPVSQTLGRHAFARLTDDIDRKSSKALAQARDVQAPCGGRSGKTRQQDQRRRVQRPAGDDMGRTKARWKVELFAGDRPVADCCVVSGHVSRLAFVALELWQRR
jgi:hypothetical protein